MKKLKNKKFTVENMTTRILLRDGASRQAVVNGIRHEIDDVDLEESVSVLRAKAAPLLQLKTQELGPY